MNGIICWPCLMLAILALLLASHRWRNELNKIQEKDVSQQNHDLWWIWPQETPSFVSSSASANPGGGPRMDVKILNNLFSWRLERWNPSKRQDQTIHRIMVHPGLLKCGKVEMESTRIDQGNLIKISWDSLGQVDLHRGEHLFGRTAHSARNERDYSR